MDKKEIFALFEIEDEFPEYLGTFSSYEKALDSAVKVAQDTVDLLNESLPKDDQLSISEIDDENVSDCAVIIDYINPDTRKRTEDDFDIKYVIIYGQLDVLNGNE